MRQKVVMTIPSKSKIKFLADWIGVNLFGWILGVATGICLGQFYVAPVVYLTFQSPIVRTLSSLFIWFPLGAWIGILQLAILRKWKIQSFFWVIFTALGWSVPAMALSWYYEMIFVKQFGYSSVYSYWFLSFALLLVGTSIGFAQILLMGNIIRKRILWVLANALGLLLCVVLLSAVLFTVLHLLPPESEIGSYSYGFLTWIVLLLTLPIAGSITAFGTGLVLMKYGIDSESNIYTDKISLDYAVNERSAFGDNKISLVHAILTGQFVVNLPVLIIILGIFGVGRWIFANFVYMVPWFSDSIFLFEFVIPLLIGFVAGWLWWSFSVPRWRRWALKSGAPEAQLQKWAILTGLVWPKGWLFEKTEFKVKE